ncbi:Copper resistance protein A precursor [Planctomycetes bacterium Pla163]|uniref:Copper resistance protein A n=1 Tax=Rohdeia mirabilis TaxID=2528008 RepID=A0A518D0R0_9BACT|nr:Copper resistance protein A precursor [Planctomycetes bacterium Pla163]
MSSAPTFESATCAVSRLVGRVLCAGLLMAPALAARQEAAAVAVPSSATASGQQATRESRLVEYELVIAEGSRGPTGSGRPALTINGSVPGPVLRFTEGDVARIHVTNALTDESTSIHWHGLLVPNGMDGVPYLNFPPIEAGTTFVYEFPIRQSGTYWYHSHTGLQEQRGVYGGIVIEPAEPASIQVERDELVVLSDWTDEDPQEVMRSLMRGSEWYALKKGNAQTMLGAWRAGELGTYLRRERNRMPPMDISDVAYDAFLANGEVHHRIEAEPGERVRLRLVNAGASTYFYVTPGEGVLEIVAADGIDVEPLGVPRLLIAIAETYDAVVEVPASGVLELTAVAQDGSGRARITVGRGAGEIPVDPPRPNLYRMDDSIVGAVDAARTKVDPKALDRPRPPSPYNLLRALGSTELPQDAPRRELELRLTGDMTTYRWGFNGKTFAEDPVIGIREGEVVRMRFVNETMMHHPMHVHGHFFRVLTPQGELSPLKHTVDVPPMATRTIEFLADEPGDWFMHCHILYHMDMGMARVISYRAHEPEHVIRADPKLYGQTFGFLDGTLTTNMAMGRFAVMHDRETFGVRWDLQLHSHSGHAGHRMEGLEREVDLFWTHLFDENLRSIAGFRFADREGTRDRFFAGARYRLPYLVWTEAAVDSEGDLRVTLMRELALAERWDLDLMLEYDTETELEAEAGLNYTLTKELAATLLWHSEHRVGLGFRFTL